jgi:hypothetical protein
VKRLILTGDNKEWNRAQKSETVTSLEVTVCVRSLALCRSGYPRLLVAVEQLLDTEGEERSQTEVQ